MSQGCTQIQQNVLQFLNLRFHWVNPCPEITFLEENLMAREALSMNSLWTLETDVSNFTSISLAHLPVTHRSVAMN